MLMHRNIPPKSFFSHFIGRNEVFSLIYLYSKMVGNEQDREKKNKLFKTGIIQLN